MTRDFQLKFCLLCVNRQFTVDKGVICGLTYNQADFKDDCDKFRVDDNEFKRICLEKIKHYGLSEKRTIVSELKKEFQNEIPDKYSLTRLTPFIKPRQQSELADSFHFKKSFIRYGLLTLIPLVFIIMGLNGIIKSAGKDDVSIVWGLVIISIIGLGLIAVDYFKNKNEVVVSDKGILTNGILVPWKIIITTAIKRVRTRGEDVFLVLSVATKEDIEIKLNGLTGPTEKIENVVELYKERSRASDRVRN